MPDRFAALRRTATPKILLLVLGCMICQMGAGFFYASRAISPDVIADLGWTRTMWSSGMAPMIFISSASQALVGTLSVRFGVRPVIVTGVLCLGATYVILANMSNLWHFYFAMMMLAFGNAGIGDVAIGGVITRWFDRYRGLALGCAMVGSNLGAIVFVHTIVSATALWSWREATLAVAIGGVAFILPFALFVVRDPKPGEAHEEAIAHPTRVDHAVTLNAREALRRPAFWIFFYTLFSYSLVQLGLVDHLVLYLTDLGYSKMEAANALELTLGAGILAKLGAGVIAMRFSARRVFVFNTFLLVASVALIPFAADARLLTLFGFAFGIATAARDVLLALAVADAFGARYFAQIYGLVMLAFFPGGGLGPLLLARIYDVFGSYESGFAICIFFVATAAVAMAFVRDEEVRAT